MRQAKAGGLRQESGAAQQGVAARGLRSWLAGPHLRQH
jgi:hypothetical protein